MRKDFLKTFINCDSIFTYSHVLTCFIVTLLRENHLSRHGSAAAARHAALPPTPETIAHNKQQTWKKENCISVFNKS